ncbi:hypothetical protein SAMN05421688_3326 [Poseidonocella pacifica]|uniref:Uncharacterized protein n=1 Tax=Poseidonocella pacifica TaxID=871651 RepID=A0A1I0YUS8_9RHOB|nr:hypothetical protein SAMN05421688_3326 [Poseidonocella pacifica]
MSFNDLTAKAEAAAKSKSVETKADPAKSDGPDTVAKKPDSASK